MVFSKSPGRGKERAVRYQRLYTEAERRNRKAELFKIVDLVVTTA